MLDDLKDWVGGLVRAEATPPLWQTFPMAPPGSDEGRLVPGSDYFRVRVHGIHLRYEREWFQKFAPVLVVATQFSYDGQEITKPAVIGPSVIEELGMAAPASPVIAGSIVAGPHPLTEPNLKVTIALQRVARGDTIGALLNVVEGASKALDLLAGITPYTALARVVVNGMNALGGGDRPIMARQDSFSPVQTSYYAMIAPVPGVDPRSLFVVANALVQVVDGKYVPFTAADYVLYSVERVAMEDIDLTRLPLHRQWQTVLGEATQASTPEIWESAKANLSSLVTMAFKSPDLIYRHAATLENEWTDRVLERRAAAQKRGDMGGAEADENAVRDRALAILRL